MINITEKAAKRVKEMSGELDVGYYCVRVKATGGGCGGIMFDIEFDDQIKENDEITELDGVKFICDEMSFQYLDNIIINYADNDFGGGFTFTGGDIKGSCGCGSSYNF
jgi:iron-sulfur cluster assembly accessory protein